VSHGQPHLTQARWLALPGEHPDAVLLRCDYRANMLAVARAVGWAADWHTLRSRPTIARIMERTGLSERTVQRWCRWLEVRGLLQVLCCGSTPQFSPGILRPGGPNEAREWLLADPARLSDTPSQEPDLENETTAPDRRRARGEDKKPRQGQRGARICATLQAEIPPLRRMPTWVLARLLRPFTDHSYGLADLAWSLQTRPDGTQHFHRDPVRAAAGWTRHRMSFWLDEAGQPLPPHSATLALRAERDRAQRWTAPPPKPPQVAVKGAQMARQMLRIAGQSL
jgi:hypothetical protein